MYLSCFIEIIDITQNLPVLSIQFSVYLLYLYSWATINTSSFRTFPSPQKEISHLLSVTPSPLTNPQSLSTMALHPVSIDLFILYE